MRSILFLLLSFLFASSAYALTWESDYAKALEQSHKDDKPLLLFFTGSDWSGLAMKMKNEVLDSIEFQEKVVEQFRCLEIDFPRHTSLCVEQTQQNTTLKTQFHIEEYPFLLLLAPSGRELIRLGYIPESGDHLADELLQVVRQDIELCQGLDSLPKEEKPLRRLYQLAQSLSREEAQNTILNVGVEIEAPFFMLEHYRRLVEEGQDVHALREKLLASEDCQVHFTVATIDFQERASTMHNPCEVIKPLELYVERFGDQDTQNVWRIEMMIAQFYLDADEWGKALKHAETAYEAAPKQMRSEIENSLMYIREQIR